MTFQRHTKGDRFGVLAASMPVRQTPTRSLPDGESPPD